MLLILMCISFIALDVVYIVVVLNYCVQCYLLIFYIEGIMEKIRESRLKLMTVMKVSGKSCTLWIKTCILASQY